MNGISRRRRILTIPTHVPFLEQLADGLFSNSIVAGSFDPGDPLTLARVTVLLPTRRACREFRQLLLRRAGGGPIFLPAVRALGALEETQLGEDADARADEQPPYPPEPEATLAPVIGALERQLVLTGLVHAWGGSMAEKVLLLNAEEAPVIPGSPGHAAHLAADLARLMDQLETEEISPEALTELDAGGHARFWQITLKFMDILLSHWPAILAERGRMAPAARRNALLDLEAARLERQPAAGPIIAAGSTGSLPATARLLRSIASLPNGAVILPGADLAAPAEVWDQIASRDSAGHPQHGMALLLKSMGVNRSDLEELCAGRPRPEAALRADLVNKAMRPAPATAGWHQAVSGLDTAALHDAFAAVTYVEAATAHEEAVAVALMLRELAEDPSQTAALVTPDRGLARRVQAELARWGIPVDDSAGMPLAGTPAGLFARHAVEVMAGGLAPVPLLALLKHPLCSLGLPAAGLRHAARMLELALLRGPRPVPTLEGLRRAAAAARADSSHHTPAARLKQADWAGMDMLFDRLEQALAGIAALPDRPLPVAALLQAHRALIEALAAGAQGSEASFWRQPDGEALRAFFDEAVKASGISLDIPLADYPALFAALLAGRAVRPLRPQHPNLHILGLLEARLLQFDRIILGGLNEGVWPAEPGTDPWLSRSLREAVGLQPPERRIGLAAHDFVQAFGAREVMLTRARHVDGSPSVASRWLLRLRAFLHVAGAPRDLLQARGERWLSMARALDRPATQQPVSPPRPAPPREARPKRLSVTQIETWLRDPYAIYARHVLKLVPLDRLDADFDGRERGTILHEVLARFMRQTGGSMEDDALDRLMALSREQFSAIADAPEVAAFWLRRFARAAEWFVEFQRGIHRPGTRIASEVAGELQAGVQGFDFTLTARADRIDLAADGWAAIFDYKTGSPPPPGEVKSGLAPQLPLEGAIAVAGGFKGLVAAGIRELAYLQVSGGTPPGMHTPLDAAITAELIEGCLDGLKRRVADYADPRTPYLSRPHPRLAGSFTGDYDHLARVKEWSRDAGENA